MTPQERLEDHVEQFNAGVRSGRFDDYGELFAPDGMLKLLGTGKSPATMANGPQEIAEACEQVFAGRPLQIVSVISATPESATFDYAWSQAPKDVAGQMILKWRGGKVACLIVTL